MLADISAYVANFADVIAEISGIDVEVVDAGLMRIAGTGVYKSRVGESIKSESGIYRHVMRTRHAFFLEEPRKHELCRGCENIDACRETLNLSMPILDGTDVVGVIGLVCFSRRERERVLASRESYVGFLARIAEAISQKLRDHRSVDQASGLANTLLHILDVAGRGVAVFDRAGKPVYLNLAARRALRMSPSEPPGALSVRRTGDTVAGEDEFVIERGGPSERGLGVVGRYVSLPRDGAAREEGGFSQALVFDPRARLGEQAARLAGGGVEGDVLLGGSRAMGVFRDALVALGDAPCVAICGEAGTGKSLAARSLHAQGRRGDRPLVILSCHETPRRLLAPELFGRDGGLAADGQGTLGRLELAGRGVLVLERLEALPGTIQSRLVRALKDRRARRVGSSRPFRVEAQIVATCREPLAELVRAGLVHEGLYDLFEDAEIVAPPLRERGADVDELAAAFLERACPLYGRAVPELGAEVRKALRAYDWPGNVRELEQVVDRVVDGLPGRGELCANDFPAPRGRREGAEEVLSMAEVERQAIGAALDRFGRDTEGKRQAAEALGIGIATLYRKLKRYEVS